MFWSVPSSDYNSRHFDPPIMDNDERMRLQNHHLELLSPARDAGIAREAILHGADAVYIGGRALALATTPAIA